MSIKRSALIVTGYMKLLKIALSTVGSWPVNALQGTTSYCQILHNTIVITQTVVVIVGQLNYLFKYVNTISFLLLGQALVTLFLAFMALNRSTIPAMKGYGKIVKIFLQEFRLTNFRHKGGYFDTICAKVEHLSEIFTYIMLFMMLCGAVSFNAVPVYLNLKNGRHGGGANFTKDLEYSLYYIYPGVNPQEYYAVTTCVNSYLSYVCGALVCGLDLFVLLMVFQIIGHLQILNTNLANFPRPKKVIYFGGYLKKRELLGQSHIELYTEEENKNIHNMLVESVNHHLLIVRFTDKVSDFFGPMLGINYMFHSCSLCLLLLECSQMDLDAILRYGPITSITLSQLILMSIVFEIVHTESEKLKDSVYMLPWECMDVSNQKSVCILLNRVQITIQVRAMGMATVGVNTMVGILKASLSYFAFLRSLNQ